MAGEEGEAMMMRKKRKYGDGWAKSVLPQDGELFPTDEEAAVELTLRRGEDVGDKGEGEDLSISVATINQIYELLHDRTKADRALEVMRKRRSLMVIRLGSGGATGRDEYAMFRLCDLVRVVQRSGARAESEGREGRLKQEACKMLVDGVLRKDMGVSIAEDSLLALMREVGGETKEQHITALLSMGWLRRSGEGASFEFSLPRIGTLVTALREGRATVLAIISRRRYPEILEKDLLKKKEVLKCGVRPGFLIDDMLGSGQIIAVRVTVGRLLRLGRLRT